jgi:hypothetical protein
MPTGRTANTRRAASNGPLRSEAASPDTNATEDGTNTVGTETNSTAPDTGSSATPKPESELTPEQREIRELKDQLAKARGSKDPETEYDEVSNPGDEKNILIHFVRDGFCELGVVWYKGQELELEPGTAQYNAAKTWANLDSSEQEEFYGEVYFRQGAWKGKDYEEEQAAKAERRRNRAAPRPINN